MPDAVPSLVGVFPMPAGPHDTTFACESVFSTSGSWRPGELRTVNDRRGLLVVVGQCLVDDEQLHRDFVRALRDDRIDAVTGWPGSYLSIVVRKDDLTAYVDLAGQYPLYHRTFGGKVAVGTRPFPTAVTAGLTPEPDPLVLAAQMICPAVPGLTEHRSVFSGLSRLGGGEALRVTRRGETSTWTYEPLVPDRSTTLADAAEALRAALCDAIRLRTASAPRITADLSGGLDSTSVAFLAARHRAATLPVFTYHHPDVPGNDLDHAIRYARLEPRFRQSLIPGTSETLTYQGLDRSRPTDLPDPGAVIQERTRIRLARIAGSGPGVHLGGEGADALLVAPPGYLGDLARHGSFRHFRRECYALARLRRVAPANVLARATLLSRTPVSRALRALAKRLEDPLDGDIEWLDAIAWWPPPGAEGTWLTGPTRRALAALVRDHAAAAASEIGPGDAAAYSEVRASAAVQRQLDERARPFGIWPQAPFLDNAVIRACTRLPAYRRADPAVRKPLLREALSGLVPDAVLGRSTKGSYSAEDWRGVRQAAAELKARVSTTRLADLGIVEPRAVRISLDRAIDRRPAPIPAFNRLLGTDLWLRQFG
jgi:asparagine synthase (glutamine-hydrolysing)